MFFLYFGKSNFLALELKKFLYFLIFQEIKPSKLKSKLEN